METCKFHYSRQITTSSHTPPFRIPSDLLRPLECLFRGERTSTQIEVNCATTVSWHGNQENLNGQKSSNLFFVRRSLCQETPNKEEATVITLFLPSRFSRVSTRKTGQPRTSRSDPTGTHHEKRTSRRGPEHISQSSGRFDQL
jgi:hypothetical protein